MQDEPTPENRMPDDWAPSPAHCVISCLGGAVAAGIVLAIFYPFFPMASLPEQGIDPSPKLIEQYAEEGAKFYSRNYAAGFAIIACCLGTAIGFGTTNQPGRSALGGAASGAITGAVGGFIIGLVVAEQFATNRDQSLLVSGIAHFICWGGIAVGCIVPIGSLNGGIKQAVTGLLLAIIAGLLISIAWNVVGSIAFTSSDLSHAIPEALVERIVWLNLSAITLAVVLSMGMKNQPPQTETEHQ